jgi:glucose/mannose-6-phosphate isomerase
LGLKNQVDQTWVEVSHSSLKNELIGIKDICVCGMGGSALGGRIIRSLDQYILNLPLEVITNYRLPNYVNENSLVILVSYSGSTEETLSAALDAINRKAKVYIVTTGGKLLDFAREKNLDHYVIDPKHNPSGMPRLGLGYSIIAIFALLARFKFINFTQNDIDQVIDVLNQSQINFGKEKPQKENPAKLFAEKVKDKGIILVSANHLTGTIHAIKNMFNENAKTFAVNFDLPELNHHFLEGLNNPKALKEDLFVLFFNSDLYPSVIKKRLLITRNMLERLGFQTMTIKPESSHPTLQAFECLSFGEFSSYYLAIINNTNPGPIPSVDYFKKELSRI